MILTVQSFGNKSYRLGISLLDSKSIFLSERHISVRLKIQKQIIETKTTCGPPLSKGFDLYSAEISKWIIYNNFHKYKKGKPTKLNFFYAKKVQHVLTFIAQLKNN